MLVVCASGNDSLNQDSTPSIPAGYDALNILSVGASNYDDDRWENSDYGLNSVDIFAPGESILSTLNDSPTALAIYRGASMSTPMVTGAAALLWANQPSLTAPQVKERLLASAKRVKQLRPFVKDGRRLDVGALLDNAVHNISGRTIAVDGTTRTTVGGVFIYLDDHSGTPDALTNSTGSYVLNAIEGGAHTVRAELNGQSFGKSVKVNLPTSKSAAPASVKAYFESITPSKTYSLYGHASQILIGGDTKPKVNADVYLNDGTVPFTRTDINGDFKISNLAPGSYVVRLIDSQNGEKATSLRVVDLPVTQPRISGGIFRYSPDGYTSINFAFTDRISPYTLSTNIKKDAAFTSQTAPTVFIGTVIDDSVVDSMSYAIYRAPLDFSAVEVYDPASKKWVNVFETGEIIAGTVAGKGQGRVPFYSPLPTLESGYFYQINAYSFDAFANEGIDTFLFSVRDSSPPAANGSSKDLSAGSS